MPKGSKPAPMQVTLTMEDAMLDQLRGAEGVVGEAKAFIITSADTAEFANTKLRGLKALKTQVNKWRDGFLEPAMTIITNAKALFNPARDAIDTADVIWRGKLGEWTQAEERRIAEERRAAEAMERKIRLAAEAKAAAELARAAEAARKAREEAKKAEEAREKAEAEARAAREAGNKKAAAEAERRAQAAAAERARQEEVEQTRIAEGDRKAAESLLAASAAAEANRAPVAESTTPKGFGMRDNWSAELEPGKTEDDVKMALCTAIAVEKRRELLPLLEIDMKAANKLAKALKQHLNAPGLKAVNNPTTVSRSA